MNHVERAMFYASQRVATVGHRGCDGPRLAPALPPGVRARQPARSASHCPTSQGFPPAAARALRFRGPGGSVGANRLAASRFAALQPATPAGSNLSCPIGQVRVCATLGGQQHCWCETKLKANEPTVNTLGGIQKKCPGNQIWTCRPGPGVTSGTLHCRCEAPPLSAGEVKDLFPDTAPVPALSKGASGACPVPTAGAGQQNCPPGQIAQWVPVPGHPPQLLCAPPPIANVSEKNKPQSAGTGSQNCPPGQIAQWVSVPGHPPQLLCAPPPIANVSEKNKPQGSSNPAGRGARFARCPCPQ